MSTGREPGQAIGASWFKKYMDQTIRNDYVLDPDGNKCPVPKYYLDYFRDNVDQARFEEMALLRLEKARENSMTPDQLRMKSICVTSKTKQLIRPYL